MSTHSQAEASPVTDVELVDAPQPAAPSTELAVIASRHAIIQADDPAEILTKAGTIAAALKDLITRQNLSMRVNGKDHVEVGGWQACGHLVGALGGTPLHAEIKWGPRLVEGATVEEYEACVEIHTLEGAVVGSAVGSCSRSESTWSGRDTYALKSMAETRAESRAYRRAVGWLVHIAGYQTTPAEEMPPQGAAAIADPWGPALKDDPQRAQAASNALVRIVGPAARDIWTDVRERCGYMPLAIADSYIAIARALDGEEAQAV